ncbi:MAG: Hpt domain-containing protein, partial [Thermodesulfobacteriota bacterium]
MSQEFMDPEIFADFIVEAKEHLETIEPNLLELEQSPENLDLLNDIFRPMHSLKGASGFLGLNKMNVLAHRSENILDELRKGNMPVTPEIMDVILSSTDLLRQMIENLESEGGEGDVDTASLIATLDALLAGGAPPAAAKPKPAKKAAAPAAPAPAPPAPAPAPAAPPAPAPEPLPPFTPTTYGLQVVAKEHLDDFLEEAKEIVESLSASLVEMEKDSGREGLVNDIFRYFHNLKGNSGIVGYAELNSLTHEAETLLNRVRKGEVAPTQGLVDVLLAAVDTIASLLDGVDRAKHEVTPVDTRAVVARLKAAGEEPAPAAPQPAPAAAPAAEAAPAVDQDDLAVFESTVGQQLANIDLALVELAKDAEQRDYVDGLYRSLVGVQNSAQYMGFGEIKTTAERTAGLVDQARKSDLSFDLMLDILKQECSILKDMVERQIAALAAVPAPAAPAPAAPAEPAAPAPAPEPEPEPAEEQAEEPA